MLLFNMGKLWCERKKPFVEATKSSGKDTSSNNVCCHEVAKAPSDVMDGRGGLPRFGVG